MPTPVARAGFHDAFQQRDQLHARSPSATGRPRLEGRLHQLRLVGAPAREG